MKPYQYLYIATGIIVWLLVMAFVVVIALKIKYPTAPAPASAIQRAPTSVEEAPPSGCGWAP